MQKMVETDIPPQTIQLWPTVKRSLAVKKIQLTGDQIMEHNKRSNMHLAWGLGAGMLAVALTIFFTLTPPGRAMAQSIISFFTRQNANVTVYDGVLVAQPTELTSAPPNENQTALEPCGDRPLSSCTPDLLQPVLSFTILQPSTLPEGMVFAGASALKGGVILDYSGDFGLLRLVETPAIQNSTDIWQIGNDADVIATNVRGLPAEYVEGIWQGFFNESDSLDWDENGNNRILRWQSQSLNLSLINYPLRGVNGPIGYDMQQLIEIASSILSGSTPPNPIIEDGISLTTAEEKAGFTFQASPWLPDGLYLYKTTYLADQNSICQYYRGTNDYADFPSLVIAQSNFRLPEINKLQGKSYYGDMLIEIPLVTSTLPLSGAQGGTAQFYESDLRPNVLCGGETTYSQRLLTWQKDGLSIALFTRMDTWQGFSFVTKAESIRIAEAINNSSSDTTAQVDPERIISLKSANQYIGMNVEEPSSMLQGLKFDHISRADLMGYNGRIVTLFTSNLLLPANGVERLVINQEPDSEMTLDQIAMGGEYSNATIKDQPGLTRIYCSEDAVTGSLCLHEVAWFEGGTLFMIEGYLSYQLPVETLLEIANSMR